MFLREVGDQQCKRIELHWLSNWCFGPCFTFHLNPFQCFLILQFFWCLGPNGLRQGHSFRKAYSDDFSWRQHFLVLYLQIGRFFTTVSRGGVSVAAHILAHPHPSYLQIAVRVYFLRVLKNIPVKVRHLVCRCVPGISFRYNVRRWVPCMWWLEISTVLE